MISIYAIPLIYSLMKIIVLTSMGYVSDSMIRLLTLFTGGLSGIDFALKYAGIEVNTIKSIVEQVYNPKCRADRLF